MNIAPTSILTSPKQPASAQAAAPSKSASQSMAADSSSSLEDSYYDKRDLNQDGYVSALEKLQYELSHPAEAANQKYDPNGQLNQAPAQLVNLLA